MGTLIRGGLVVGVQGRQQADVLIEGDKIAFVGTGIGQLGNQVLDAAGCYVIPGGIDPHTHIEMPAGDLGFTADDWFSGTAAAAAGGTTTVIDMITPDPGGTLRSALADWRERAGLKAVCDYSFHMGVIAARPEVLAEMAEVVQAGIPSFKLYLAYKGRIMVDDGAAFRIMREAGRLGAWTLVHAENGDVIEVLIAEARAAGRLGAGTHGATRPTLAEGEATHRAIQLAALAGGAPLYLVHVTCQEALLAVMRAQQAGQKVAAECCTHHLVLTDREYGRTGMAAAPYVLSPPLRGPADVSALWGGLEQGALSVVSSDHCPWNLKGQKDRGAADFSRIPNGGPGVEERMTVLWTHAVASGRWSPEQFVARTSAGAAATFGLTSKGAVAPGYDADIVVWDPTVQRTLSAQTQTSKVDHSLFEGTSVQGLARYTLVRGKVVAAEGKAVGEAGWGRFLRRVP